MTDPMEAIRNRLVDDQIQRRAQLWVHEFLRAFDALAAAAPAPDTSSASDTRPATEKER